MIKDKNFLYFAILLIAVIILFSTSSSSSDDNTISLQGFSEEFLTPDQFNANLGVQITSTSSEDASRQAQAVIESLKNLLPDSVVIENERFNVHPINLRTEESTQFRVTRTLSITTKDVDEAGNILSLAVSNGANQVNGHFSLSDEAKSELKEVLIESAVKDARKTADTMANTAGTRIVGVKSMSIQQGFSPYFRAEVATALDSGVTDTIDPGVVSESLTVNVQFLIR